ncbi:unnamed protein product [Pseudo-nitzschia multistriata]|uniref:Alpha-ketoglutarate-dependent dioxygenase FTO n=1 Tax=Pseudo-nitzschia multistriata TaxID=183589 RepID=A0A448Z616_9STRA|nr:unnamed protein product [Pseudo-nitzschia multistriata]
MGKMGKSGSKRKQQRAAAATTTTVSLDQTVQTTKPNREQGGDIVLLPQEFPPHLPKPPRGSFLRDEAPYRDSFGEALSGPYEGFAVDDAKELSLPCEGDNTGIHEEIVLSSLETMEGEGIFRTDVTQPFGLGTKCAKTYVTRCLVGERGTTYKYLGLRMFAHPWTDGSEEAADDRGGKKRKRRKRAQGCDAKVDQLNQAFDEAKTTSTIQELGKSLTMRTANHLRDLDQRRRQRRAPATRGRPNFDICLINRMESSPDLKPYNFGVGEHNNKSSRSGKNEGNGTKTSVSWHADSSLEHYSTIAVYQTLLGGCRTGNDKSKSKATKKNSDEGKWWVALRVAHHSEGPQASQRRRGSTTEASIVEDTPPIAVSLPSGSAYYLLDDFNHHHQHTVLTTGDAATAGVRYSCTFRLLRDSHNVRDWIDRGNAAIRQFHKKGPKLWRSEQLLLTEIESEWIRQFYIQGTGHHKLLWEPYWKNPMKELLSIWSQLEARTKQTMDLLRAAAEGKCGLDAGNGTETKPTKAERKARDRRRKALGTIRDLVSRIHIHNDDETVTELYLPFAELLEARAAMRELWGKREKDHVFHEMPPDCRPMEVPLRFGDQTAAHRSSGAAERDGSTGNSPLPASPAELRELAKQLARCGKAYREGNAALLPPPWDTDERKPPSPTPSIEKKDGSPRDHHAKPMDWPGWDADGTTFGLELQQPWAGFVANGKKAIDVRSYALPPALLGKKVMIIESASGRAGVSALGNRLRLTGGGTTRVIGWCVFSSVKAYETGAAFRADERLHLVAPDNPYGWKDGTTKNAFGWVVGEHHRFGESSPAPSGAAAMGSGIRRFRSLFQLAAEEGVEPNPAREKKNNSKRSSATRKKKPNGRKKRKRF